MKKKVPVVKLTTPDEAAEPAGLPLSATVAMADVAESMRAGLLVFATSAGLVVMQQMLTAELTSIVGGVGHLGPKMCRDLRIPLNGHCSQSVTERQERSDYYGTVASRALNELRERHAKHGAPPNQGS